MSTFDAQSDGDESMVERRASNGLTALADWPQPLSGVSIEAAVRAGRLRAARRRRAAALGTAAVFAAAAFGAWGAAQQLPHHGTANTPVVGMATGPDPLVPPVGFGYLPGPSTGGFNWTLTADGGYNFSDENGTVNVSLTLGTKPGGSFTDAGTVDGQPAQWDTRTSDPDLVWQYGPGAWAELLADGATKPEALKIADSLQFGGQKPLAMPFHLPELPAGFTVAGAAVMHNTQYATVVANGALALCAVSSGCQGKDRQWHDILSLTATRYTIVNGHPSAPGSPEFEAFPDLTHGFTQTSSTVKIDGVSATCYEGSDGSISLSYFVDGLMVGASVNGAAAKAIGGRDGLVRYLDTITLYGGNPSGWTTDVIG